MATAAEVTWKPVHKVWRFTIAHSSDCAIVAVEAILVVFIAGAFGVLGMQLFRGHLRHRCYGLTALADARATRGAKPKAD